MDGVEREAPLAIEACGGYLQVFVTFQTDPYTAFCTSLTSTIAGCLFVCFEHRLFTPASTPRELDFCVHGRFYSRLKGSRDPSSERFDMPAENLSV